MKILEASKIREADAYTMKYEPIESIDLMERAAWQCAEWFFAQPFRQKAATVLAGPGNNGGDGLALARMLADETWQIKLYILQTGTEFSEDFSINLARIESIDTVSIHYVKQSSDVPVFEHNALLIDALFGSGLSRPISGLALELVQAVNTSHAMVVSIDIPSGLFAEENYTVFRNNEGAKPIIKAHHTLTFEFPYLSFFFPENESYIGKVHVLPIGLHPGFIRTVPTIYETVEEDWIRSRYRERRKFSHKGSFGHTLIIAGSYGKMGAAILAARAALRSGAGLLTVHFPNLGYNIMQTAVPEAIASIDPHDYHLSELPELNNYEAVAIGPGIGTKNATRESIMQLITHCQRPLVVDADGLNILASLEGSLEKLPANSILTPHPREFERLFGPTEGAYMRMLKQRELAQQYSLIIILKGAHTTIALPDGRVYFNTTGNPGMATAGSGDVLTGVIAALLSQAYAPEVAAIFGVYAHGLAGDLAAQKNGQMGLIASDIIEHLGIAFARIENSL